MYSNNYIKTRILVTGANGLLGQRIINYYLAHNDVQILATSFENKPVIKTVDYLQCDITQREAIKKIAFDFYPDFIINTAALTNVDLCESERELAWKTNVKAVEYFAEVARVLDAHIIHISSDYVFDGKRGPYSETSAPNPLGYYGRTKLASENTLRISGSINTILRTNVLYGTADGNKTDFVKWLIKNLKEGNNVNVVTDQFGNPTFVDDLVQAIRKVVETRKTGIYNIGGIEFMTRYDFALLIAEYFELDSSKIFPIKTEELHQTAHRPLQSGLYTIKAQAELDYKPHSIKESFSIIKKILSL